MKGRETHRKGISPECYHSNYSETKCRNRIYMLVSQSFTSGLADCKISFDAVAKVAHMGG